jgi:serine/threonine-protein kinase RsbW
MDAFHPTVSLNGPWALTYTLRLFVEWRARKFGPNPMETDIEVALHEALVNAVVHGNDENSCKRVYVTCRCYMDGEVSITVRDQGKGFDSSSLLNPTLRENLLLTHGRGIYLMKTLMDEVSFEEGGAVVMMRKNSNASSADQRTL